MITDEQAMSHALELAMKGEGKVSPNPKVGAVIVKNNVIIGTGWHKEFGADHAEIDAIKNASESVEGATIYVNLEPCSHDGKQPPCVQEIIKRKFAKVVIGTIDPNPMVSGMGVSLLKNAGIDVKVGVLEDECIWLNRFFIKHILTREPYIALKIAQSINGSIAAINGESRWISNEESRKLVHRMRGDFDAVLVGRTTAVRDNPELTVRLADGRNPWRVILDSNISMPLTSKVFTDETRKKTIVFCKKEAIALRRANNLKLAGVTIIDVPQDDDGRLSLKEITRILFEDFNIGSILVEGGAKIYSSFMDQSMVDELHLFMSPIVMGSGLNAFSHFNTMKVQDAKQFELISQENLGQDLYFIFKPKTGNK